MHEEPTQGDGSPKGSANVVIDTAPFDVRARSLEELRVVHSGRAGGLAGEAPQAVAHFIGELARDSQLFIGDGPHEGDPPSGTVALAMRGIIRRASGQAHAAVHALLKHGVIELFERGCHGSIEDFTGVEHFAWIERLLDLPHQFMTGIAKLLFQPRLFRQSNAVLAGDGATEL